MPRQECGDVEERPGSYDPNRSGVVKLRVALESFFVLDREES
jgi:hypothetical protein